MKPKSNKDIFDIVQEYLATFDKKEADALKEAIKKYFFFRNGMSDFKPSGVKHSEKYRKQVIRQLYFGFGIPYHDYMDRAEVFTSYSPNPNPLEVFAHLEYMEKLPKEEQKFIDKYVPILEPYIKSAQERIWVYDYLGIGGESSIIHYSKAHEIIFRLIEDQMESNLGMNYLRILVLPLSEQIGIFDKKNKMALAHVKRTKTSDAMAKCSLETFTHICRCLQKYSERAKFYIAWRPARMYHYGIIDENYIVSEYYRYNSLGEFLPNLLFIEKASNEHGEKQKELLDIYIKELVSLTERTGKSHKVNKKILESALRDERSFTHSMFIKDLEDRDYWEKRKDSVGDKILKWNEIFPDNEI